MTATDRRTAEQLFHDRQAAARAAEFRTRRANLRFEDDDYLDHETWVRPAFARLGDVRGKRALDYGCGHGMAAVVLARAGADVTAFDLSPGYVGEVRERLRANSVNGRCVVADGEELPFPDGSFDAVWGNAILHHLDLERAGRELLRVLRPGGVAVFCEPWGGNPVLAFARRFLPYPGKDRTPDERPLTRHDLAPLRAIFPQMEVEGHQLLGMIRRAWRAGSWANGRRQPAGANVDDQPADAGHSPSGFLNATDARLLRACPPLRNWCRYVVITLRKE